MTKKRKSADQNVLTDEQKELLHSLNPRQQKFVMNMVKGMNQTQAYKASGYNPKSDDNARSMAAKLSTNVNVKAAYESLMRPAVEKEASEAVATRNEALEILSGMARRDLDPFSQSYSDKLTAIKLLGQMQGWDKASDKDKEQTNSLLAFVSGVTDTYQGNPADIIGNRGDDE